MNKINSKLNELLSRFMPILKNIGKNTSTVLKNLWEELDPVLELFIYIGIAFALMKLFSITFIQGISIVFIYFILNLLRLLVEMIIKNKSQ